MDYLEFKAISDSLPGDEAGLPMGLLKLRVPEPLDAFSENAKGAPFRPNRGMMMWENGGDDGFKHARIKSCAHSSLGGETMNEVNSLMSDFDAWSYRCRGISTRHLQGYLCRFLFQKLLRYAKEAMDRPGAQLRSILASSAVITCQEILKEAMPIDLYEAYGIWRYGIFAEKNE